MLIALGEPPAALGVDARGSIAGSTLARCLAATAGLDPAPVASLDVQLLGQLGVDGEERIEA